MGSRKSERQFHFLLGSTCRNLLGCAFRFGGISPSKWFRFARVLTFATIGFPLRIWESLRYHSAVRKTQVEPIFIVGHWQSGLSPLQFLLANDPQFAYLNLYQAEFPWVNISTKPFIGPLVKFVTKGKSRGSDSFKLHLGLPQGSDWPMAAGSDLSFYHAYVFPQQAESVFRRSILFEGISEARIDQWKKLYRFLIQKISYTHGRQRVILRNASDTGRIKAILEEFPNAKFIHVVRNPYTTLQATNERWEGMCGNWSFQTYDLNVMRRHSLNFYELAMRRYYDHEHLIPPQQLVTVRYEEIQTQPLEVLREIYSQFEIAGFEESLPQFEQYVSGNHGSLAGHTGIDFTPDEMTWIRERLAFVFDKMGYSLDPEPTPAAALEGKAL